MRTVSHDLVTVGRIGIDLYPLRSGVPLSEVDTFARFLGGSATNVAVAAARLGLRSAVVSRTGDDPFAGFVHTALRGYGVDDSFVTPVEGRKTPITFCEIFPPDDFPIVFYRDHAPDLVIRPEELDADALGAARIVWLTGTGLSAEPSRSAHAAILGLRRGNAGETVLDLDYRPMLWPDRATAEREVRQALAAGAVTVAVGNREECEVATGRSDPDQAADVLLGHGVRLAIVKLGPAGVLAKTSVGQRLVVPPRPVEVVNGLGAGDAFGGALCLGLLRGWPLDETLRFANAAGAYVAARLACSDAMPTTDEVYQLMGETR
ncbi:MAG: 5-dehydro-2-deoxygluconokinase [Hamadaea sp.]|uniref:5-dehydro-2-deoxygluconokinase n=1 Tax=Hamadaea sp. TaxID=2024425 RepID=UPI0017C62B05|nr:5-dehydro-2-deoxygluconokinase [Hamadaea sp.]NUR71701.1 5-dehydro-2-deoxygluconokinase [Hamadaea sp.]NUT19015.1 5-dehydro-2-deoxygluconokinase [Hamadaea sp.]